MSEKKTKRTDRTKRKYPTKRSGRTERSSPTHRTLTKDLSVMDYGAGEIESDEFAQVGLTKKGRLTDKAPVEAISGIDAPKGKSLRRKGIQEVGDLRKKIKSKKPVTKKSKNYAVYSSGGSFLGSYKHEEDAYKHIIKDSSRYMIGYDSQGELQDKFFEIQAQREKDLIASREAKVIEKIIKAQEEPQFKGRTLEEIGKEVQAKEDAKILAKMKEAELKYFIYDLKSGNLLTEPYHSRKEAKQKIAFISRKKKGQYHIITAESLEEANQKFITGDAAKELAPEAEIKIDEPKKFQYYVFTKDSEGNYISNVFDNDTEALSFRKGLDESSSIVYIDDPVIAKKKGIERLERDIKIDKEIAEQKALRKEAKKTEKELRKEFFEEKRQATAGRDLHSTHARDFELGEVYYYRWTSNFNQYEGKVKITKINPKSVRIQLIDPPKGYKKGQNWNIRLVEQTKNNGLFQLTSEETSQVQEVVSKQVNVSVTDTQYKDRREFRKMGLVPERDADGKFIGWRGNVDPDYISKLEKLGTVEKTEEAYKQEQVHLDEIARINRKLDVLEEREFKKSKQSDQLSDEIKELLDVIPMGQPILVGHHSEKKHRKHLQRIDNKERKRYELGQEIEKIKSAKNTLERQKAAMKGRSAPKVLDTPKQPENYFSRNTGLKIEVEHEIADLPKDKAEAEKQKVIAQKVSEKISSKKSWSKGELEDLMAKNNIYVDLRNVTGRENWISDSLKAADHSIRIQEKEMQKIDDFEFSLKRGTVDQRLRFVSESEILYLDNRKQRIKNMEDQMALWQIANENSIEATDPEEITRIQKHYFDRNKKLARESDTLFKERQNLDVRFFEDVRGLPSDIGGKIGYAAQNDFTADSFLVKQRNDPRWKEIPNNKEAEQTFQQRKDKLSVAIQQERVKQVKQVAVQKKIEPDDPNAVIAFQAENISWVMLPDGRYIKESTRSKNNFVKVSGNKYIKSMKEEDLKAIYLNKDFTRKEQWFLAFALIHGWDFKDYQKFKDDPEFNGMMMDRSRSTALVDETAAPAIDLSVHEGNYMNQQEFGTPKVVKYKNSQNESVEAYEIRKGLYYDKEFVDQTLAFIEPNKKHYSKVLVKIPHEAKPIAFYIDDTRFLYIIIAPTSIKDVELEDYSGE